MTTKQQSVHAWSRLTPDEQAAELVDHKHVHALLAGGVREPRPQRAAAPSDQEEFSQAHGRLVELCDELREAKYVIDPSARVACKEAVKVAIVEQVAKCVAILRHEADEIRGRGGDFRYIAAKFDAEAAKVERSVAILEELSAGEYPPVSSAALWHLRCFESQVLPGLREDLRKAEFNAVAPGPSELPQYVTLDTAAALVSRKKRSLEHYKSGEYKGAGEPLPDPDVKGGGGKPDQWLYPGQMKPWLEATFKHKLPDRLPEPFRAGADR